MEYRDTAIFVTGTTPQIITETLYALHIQPHPIYPTDIFILTTTVGRDFITRELLEKERLRDFYIEFGIEEKFPAMEIITDGVGTPMSDIRTETDNDRIGDFIVDFVREKAQDDNVRLHCSVAGGRKTMGFYLGSALSLFGRPWDRLYHVLVTPEFESHPDFYWKPAKGRTLETRDRSSNSIRTVSTDDAEITLAELPFIRLRGRIALNGKSFRELVYEGQREIDTASLQLPLRIDIAERTINIGDVTIEVVPVQLVIYLAFIREKLKRCRYPERPYCLDCTKCFPFIVDLSNREALEEMSEDYKIAYRRNVGRVKDFLGKWKEGLDMPSLRQNVSKINRTIKEHLSDDTAASFYTITAVGRHGNKRHGIKVEKGKITIS